MKVRSSYVAAATLGLAILGIGLNSPASAVTVFTANLTHDQEAVQGPLVTSTGDPRPMSFGTATFVLNDARDQLSMFATVFNIDITGAQTSDTNDNLVAAHIHVHPFPPPSPLPPTAPVRWGFFGAPDNDTSPDQLVVTPLANGVGGTFSSIWDLSEGNNGTTLAAQLPGIFAELAYLNFHTVQFPGGEIRGQLIVPGPIAGAGLPALLALGGFVWARRRKAAVPAAA